ncbi:hypothetical protein [Krasilnikovia sp. MM14-A1259]|uniref:hypothetical protein n=1 Tax=Krasilnikovia sp. MM14-A1259 TaxID=3373539 RepID=UPI00399CE3E9
MTTTDRPNASITPEDMTNLLEGLRAQAGGPSNRQLDQISRKGDHRCAATTISENLRKTDRPQSWEFIQAFVLACQAHVLRQARNPNEHVDLAPYDLDLWKARYTTMRSRQQHDPEPPHRTPAPTMTPPSSYSIQIHGSNGVVAGSGNEVTLNFGTEPVPPSVGDDAQSPEDPR